MPRIPGIGDLGALLQAQTEALATLPSTLLALNRTIRSLARSVEQSREAIAAMQHLAVRMDRLMDEFEEPARALAPGLQRLANVLNDPVVESLPDTLRELQDNVMPVVRNLGETQQKVAAIASSTDRITALVDEAGARLGGLPGASLLRRPRRPGEPPAAPTAPPSPASPPAEM